MNALNKNIDEATNNLGDRLAKETSTIFSNIFDGEYKANRIKATAAHAIGGAAVLCAMAANPEVSKSTVAATGVCGALGVIGTYNDYSIADSLIQDNANLLGRFVGSVVVTSIFGGIAGYFLNDRSED